MLRAQELLYCGDVWPSTPERRGCGLRKLMVMNIYAGRRLTKSIGGRVPQSLRKTVYEAIKFLHQKSFIHGDVRCPNIAVDSKVLIDIYISIKAYI